MSAKVVYVDKCSNCKKIKPVCKMKGYEKLIVCEQCYEDTLLTVSSLDYYLLQEHMQQLKNLPIEQQLLMNSIE